MDLKSKKRRVGGLSHMLQLSGVSDDASFDQAIDSICETLQKLKSTKPARKKKAAAKQPKSQDREHTGGRDREA